MRNVQCLTTCYRLPPIFSNVWLCLIVGHVDWNREGYQLISYVAANFETRWCVAGRCRQKGMVTYTHEVLAETCHSANDM